MDWKKCWIATVLSFSVVSLLPRSVLSLPADEPGQSHSSRETPAVRVVRDLQPAVAAVYTYRKAGRGSGSAAVIDPRGYLLTVAHIVGDQHVVLLGGRPPLRASLVGSIAELDLAVLSLGQRAFDRPASPEYPLDGTPLAHVPLGIASEVMLGETILNLGSPGGRGIVVTSGIVSAVNFAMVNALALATQKSDGFQQYVQFDAASNPGNSGGAIVNMDGQQIGVVTASIRGEEGVHFAVPIETVRRYLPDILHSELRHRFVAGIQIDPQIADVRVVGIEPDSPASKLDLRVGDQVIAVDGRKLRDPIDWEFTQYEWRPDQTVVLTLRRSTAGRDVDTEVAMKLSPRLPKSGVDGSVVLAPGLQCRAAVYDPQLPDPLADEQRPVSAPTIIPVPTATPPGLPRDDHYELLIDGFIEIKQAGLYRLGTKSDDGSRVYLHGRLVADNGGNHSPQLRSGWIDVAIGKHPIQIEYYEDEGNQSLELYISEADGEPRLVEATELFHEAAPDTPE